MLTRRGIVIYYKCCFILENDVFMDKYVMSRGVYVGAVHDQRR